MEALHASPLIKPLSRGKKNIIEALLKSARRNQFDSIDQSQ
jgi:hypothetical protein